MKGGGGEQMEAWGWYKVLQKSSGLSYWQFLALVKQVLSQCKDETRVRERFDIQPYKD